MASITKTCALNVDSPVVSYFTNRPIPAFGLDEGVRYAIARIAEMEAKSSVPILVLIAGGTSSGKSDLVSERIRSAFAEKAKRISVDDYYSGKAYLKANKITKGDKINFDDPRGVDLDLFYGHMEQLRSGMDITKSIYDFEKAEPCGSEHIKPVYPIIIAEGLFALNERLVLRRDSMADSIIRNSDFNIFVKVSNHGALIRRTMRDLYRSAWPPTEIVRYMINTTIPMYTQYVEPTMKFADIIIENEYNPVIESKRACIEERQAKYKFDINPKDLLKLGAERMTSVRQTDYYYKNLENRFKDTGEVLRIRKEGEARKEVGMRSEEGKITLTYKGTIEDESGVEVRHKFEFEIEPDVEQALLSLYGASYKTITKERAVFQFNGIILSVDTNVVKSEGGVAPVELGNFIEVKVPKSMSIGRLEELLRPLGVSKACYTAKAYSDM